jgi:hypothetical protein
MTKQVPLSLTEAFISAADADEDEILGEIRDVMKASREAAEHALDGVAKVKANAMQTPAQNAKQARELAWSFFQKEAPKIDSARERADKTMEKILRDTFAPAAPKDVAGAMCASEIRARLAALGHDARAKAIHDAIESGQDDIISAITHGPVLLSGLGPAERDARLDQWRRKRFPQELARLEKLRKAYTALDRGTALFRGFIADLADGDGIDITAAEKSAAAAAQAIAAAKAA